MYEATSLPAKLFFSTFVPIKPPWAHWPDTYSLHISSPHKTLQTLDEFPPQKHLQRPQQSRTVFRLVGWSEFMSKSSCLNLGCLQFVNHPAVYSKREANSFAQAHKIKQDTAHRWHRGLRRRQSHTVPWSKKYKYVCHRQWYEILIQKFTKKDKKKPFSHGKIILVQIA